MSDLINYKYLSKERLEELNFLETFNFFKNSPKFSIKYDTYFEVYENVFKHYRDRKITFVEVGVSNGGSLFIWKKFFHKDSRIIGIDLNPNAKKLEEYGFEIFTGNQSEKKFWDNFYNKVGKVDIVFDDGGHKNIQQIATVDNSINNINEGGLIIVEDAHSSFIKWFYNPSKYSFISFTNLIIDSINRRCIHLNYKKQNSYTKNVYAVEFFESIVVLKISQIKCKKSSMIFNDAKDEYFLDFRNSEYFNNFRNLIENKLKFLYRFKIFRKILRKILYRNILFNLFENKKIKKIKKKID